MSNLARRIELANRELGRSVIRVCDVNPEHITEATCYVGIKEGIPTDIIKPLLQADNFIQLTVDKAADKGRAIDTDLINPLTYRVMTGSSSGGPINLLKGITDVAVGTDGGGSVLAPAMSCQLPAVIGAGLGLVTKEKKLSTDRISFSPSIGVIGKRIIVIKEVLEILLGQSLTTEEEHYAIAIPKRRTVTRPDGTDMFEVVMTYLSQLDSENITIREVDMSGIDNRQMAIQTIKTCFESADFILTCEGPIDVFGYGETIPQQFGIVGKNITAQHGKYLIRAANMCQTTAITLPTEHLASGFVIIAKNGLDFARRAFLLAEQIEQIIELPDVWHRYFLQDG